MNPLLWKLFFSPYVLAHWTLSSFLRSFGKVEKPIHIMFCMVDHYEPGTGKASPALEQERVDALVREFPILAGRHWDSSGTPPKRTWFFPPHYHRHGSLRKLVSLCERGYGEIELHLHHGKIRPDTPENLEATIRACIEDYARFGIFGTQGGSRKFGFIHGDWALNNSLGGRYCGVDNELAILKRTGCYADFTFPSRGASNPLQINSLFYANDLPGRPKSHSRGTAVCVSGMCDHGLMLIQGPLFPYSIRDGITGLRISGDMVGSRPVPDSMVDAWVKTGIHVRGRKSWVFIKTHTHGAVDAGTVLGRDVEKVYTRLENLYNDGKNFVLHYVTAREMYNIIKALESGAPADDPEPYRDHLIIPPAYDSAVDLPEACPEVQTLVSRTYA